VEAHTLSSFGAVDAALAVVVAVVFVLLVSLLQEPARQRFMAILVAGAGAAYLNGGLGAWEIVFTAVATFVAYRGLQSYRFIGAAWLMHTGWDVVHHFHGHPIMYFAPTSSGQCAITDALISVWFFAARRAYTTFFAPARRRKRARDCLRDRATGARILALGRAHLHAGGVGACDRRIARRQRMDGER
jgi:hypothetical protein